VWQTTPLTPEQKELLSTLQAEPPPRYLSIKAPHAAKA
jgi:hypothetical protein